MEVPVVVESKSGKRVTAEPFGRSELRVESEGARNPWLETLGRSAEDPDFEEFLAAIDEARAAEDRE